MYLSKILLILFLMLILIWRKVKIGYVLILGSVFLMIFFKKITFFPELFLKSFSQIKFFEMLGIVLGIQYLSGILQKRKVINKAIEHLSHIFKKDSVIIATIPAIVGLLPMPGGAMFSAPLVNEAGKKNGINNEDKTLINYWFRHVWEFIFPLYPGFILCIALSGKSLNEIVAKQFPYTIVALIIGYIFLLRKIKSKSENHLNLTFWENFFGSLKGLWPILIIIILTLTLKINVVLAIAISMLLTIIRFKLTFRELWDLAKERIKPELIIMVMGIFLFKTALEEYGELKYLSEEIMNYGLNPYLTLGIITFLMGVLTGITVGYVSIVFPMIPFIFLMNPIPYKVYMISYFFGFMGILVSPTHLCLILTKEYFEASFSLIYRKLVPMVLIFSAIFIIANMLI